MQTWEKNTVQASFGKFSNFQAFFLQRPLLRVRQYMKSCSLALLTLLLPKSDWPDVMLPCMKEGCGLEITANFSLKLLLATKTQKSLKAPQSCTWLSSLGFLGYHVSSVGARHAVINYPTAALLWIYCQHHRLGLNDNVPDKQLKSVFAARTPLTAMTAEVRLDLSTQVKLSL